MQEVLTMNQGGRSRVSRITSKRRKSAFTGVQIATRLLILSLVIGLLGIALALIAVNLSRTGDPTAVEFDLAVNSSLNPAEALVLGSYLAANHEALNTPRASDSGTIQFEVLPGQNAAQIADELVSDGIISDPTLFRNYVHYYDLDRQIEAGSYELSASMTIPEVAVRLTDATPAETSVRVTEGWRREQIGEFLDGQPDIPFTGAEFLAATGVGTRLPSGSSLGGVIAPGATLEGFLFPDTYRIAVDATATDLVEKMLLNFETKVTSQMRADAAAQGFSLFEVITLASIVEREAAVPDERVLIASVYLNRLRAGTKLEADPTVQYAMGYQPDSGQWWNLSLTQEDYYSIDSPYNTYLYAGLPPGPIANPGLDSIRAVIYPAQTPYIFFRTACDGSGRHVFATTFEEHVNNACP